MTILIFLLFLVAVIASIVMNISVVYAMALGCVLFYILARTKHYPARDVLSMMLAGVKKSYIAFLIFLLVGILTAAWRASGTISYFVYWGMQLISPGIFLLCVYLLLSAESMLIGTAFGSTGTLGVMFMVMAKAGGVPELLVAGAIIAGSMMGDRGSPMSGSANLVAAVTGTRVNDNVKHMARTAVVPFLITAGLFALLSMRYPLGGVDTSLALDIAENYRLSPILLLPALIVLILPLVHVDIKLTMGLSLLVSGALALLYQGMDVKTLFDSLIFGYRPNFTGLFAERIAGGGLQSMFLSALVVVFASAFAGIFEHTNGMKPLEKHIGQLARKTNLYTATLVTGQCAAMIGCSQAFAVLMTGQLMQKTAKDFGASDTVRAIDIENTVVILCCVVPWNVCCSAQLAILGVSPACLLVAFYIYLVPLWNLATSFCRERHGRRLVARGA